MLNYKENLDSKQTWATDIRYTFSSMYNTTDFTDRLNRDKLSITGNGNVALWTYAIDEVKKVTKLEFTPASSASTANLGLLTGEIANSEYVGFGYRNPQSGAAVTSGLSAVEPIGIAGTYIHELLHVLGIDHPGLGAGDDPKFAHYTADSTIMRYRQALSNPTNNEQAVRGKNITSPMVYDIALLQQKYGAKIESVPTYQVQGTDIIAHTLWMGGAQGTEHINASAVTNASTLTMGGGKRYNLIDLRGGFKEKDGLTIPRFSYVDKEVFSIALDSEKNWQTPITIENATGSRTWENFIIGNNANNRLIGGNADDTIIGGGEQAGGKDFLYGGEGDDVVIRGKIFRTTWNGKPINYGGLIDASDRHFNDAAGSATSMQGSELYGGLGRDTLIGGAGVNTLDGGKGIDFIDADQDDIAYGGESTDLIASYQGVEQEDGSVLLGSTSWAQLYGGTGEDALVGDGATDHFGIFGLGIVKGGAEKIDRVYVNNLQVTGGETPFIYDVPLAWKHTSAAFVTV